MLEKMFKKTSLQNNYINIFYTKSMNINKELLIYINSLWENKIIEKIVLIFADSPIFFLPIFLIVYWIYYWIKNIDKQKNLLFIFYSCVIWILIALIIQNLIHVERPETIIWWTWKLLLKHIPDASFPSDHATVSVAFLTWLFLAKYKKTFWTFLAFVIIMNISRIIAWVHWPFDILIWSIIWLISALISFKVLTKIKIIKTLNKQIIKLSKIFKL